MARLLETTRTALQIRRGPRPEATALVRGRPAIAGGPKDLAWIHPVGREMTGDDWHDGKLHVISI